MTDLTTPMKPFDTVWLVQPDMATKAIQPVRVIIDAKISRPPEKGDLNQRILGRKIADRHYWQTLVAIKTKYLLPETLRSELLVMFKQFENKFNQDQYPASRHNQILIAWMRAIATWNKDISQLVIGNVLPFLPAKVRLLFLRCLQALSNQVAICYQIDDLTTYSNSVIPTSTIHH